MCEILRLVVLTGSRIGALDTKDYVQPCALLVLVYLP